MSKPTRSSIERLKTQRDQLNAKIQAMEARTKSGERKKETRRKILIGSYYLDKARTEGTFEELRQLMAGYLSRDSDRRVFNLATDEGKSNPDNDSS